MFNIVHDSIILKYKIKINFDTVRTILYILKVNTLTNMLVIPAYK